MASTTFKGIQTLVSQGAEIEHVAQKLGHWYGLVSDIKEAEKLDKILQPLHHSMFVESNPSPVKYAAKLLNLCEDDVRLPLVKVTETTKEIVKKALVSAQLI